MDKSNWPKSWKDQYNSVIQRRRMTALVRAKRAEITDAKEFPSIWRFNVTEETIFAFVAYNFPLESTLKKLIQSYITYEKEDEIRLSSRYLFNTEKIFPGYYSDRERLVVLFNRFKDTRQMSELQKWIDHSDREEDSGYIHLLFGILLLNEFLVNLKAEETLLSAIHHLSEALSTTRESSPLKALNAVLAFAHYMNRDFESSIRTLRPSAEKDLEIQFADLIKKAG
jgi:hypothetical protein